MRFFHLVEGAAAHRFLTLQRQVQVVELGVRFGWLSQYLLSRYEWIRLVGVDLLVDPDRYLFGNVSVALEEVKGRLLPFGSRVRLMMPMSTTRASQLLAKEGLSVDLLVLDARFSREGMLEDLQNYLPLLAPGARVVGRWGLHLIVELHEKLRQACGALYRLVCLYCVYRAVLGGELPLLKTFLFIGGFGEQQ